MRQLNWRTVAVLAIGVALGVSMMATPAAGHVGGTVGHLWTKHIRPLADQRYYKKTEVNAKVAVLESRVAALESKLAAVTYDDTTKIFRFTGVNVQVVDGSGDTAGTTNGRGNLIIGYNESGGGARSGSHNLVLGPFHTYTSYGGLVAGYQNFLTGAHASVTGGRTNSASGLFASVSGGTSNSASGVSASVSGGAFNTAGGQEASVSGGNSNTAGGSSASVSGGNGNTAGAPFASVSGGSTNTAATAAQWLGGTIVVRTASVLVPGGAAGNGSYDTALAQGLCLAGEQLLSGGAHWDLEDPTDQELPLTTSFHNGTKWVVLGGNDTSVDRTLTAQAVCLGP